MILCLDGLSLERHKSFLHKLCSLPMNFTNAYQQSIVFQKALSRVIEISGPLHTSFHMLQVVYTIYKSLLSTVQQCLGWKRVNNQKVSDNYRLCLSMVNLLYEELFRYLFFTFLVKVSSERSYYRSEDDNNSIKQVLQLSNEFSQYVDHLIDNTKDENWKYTLCFFKLTSLFKLYESSTKSGDTIGMEYAESEFCGIFVLMEKHKYVEIVLSQMERKYLNINYKQLQEVRMNTSCRYKKDDEKSKRYYPMHVLDSVMENINMWVKMLPVGQDPESWILHIPNVTLARRCVLFETSEYKRGLLNYDEFEETGSFEYRQVHNDLYVEPKKRIEKARIFELLTKFLGSESKTHQKLCVSRMNSIANELETPPKKSDHVKEKISSSIDTDLENIFC